MFVIKTNVIFFLSYIDCQRKELYKKSALMSFCYFVEWMASI